MPRGFHHRGEQGRALVTVEFVHDIAERDAAGAWRVAAGRAVLPEGGRRTHGEPARLALQAEGAQRGARLVQRPRMHIDAEHARAGTRVHGPGGTRRAGAAAEVDDVQGGGGRLDRREHVSDGKEAARCVVKGVGGAFARGVEGTAVRQPRAALHIGGRERPQGAGHFGRGHVAQVAGFEVAEPARESSRAAC